MFTTVELHDQSGLRTVEIEDVTFQRVLATELGAE